MSNMTEHDSQAHAKHHGRKLHKDWRLWLMVILMLVAMAIYLLTLDLR
jgi:hypothetical protein